MAKETTTEITRYSHLSRPVKAIYFGLVVAGLVLTVLYIFTGFSFMGEMPMSPWGFYSLFIAIFSACVFLTIPARKKDISALPWYDIVGAVAIFVACLYMYTRAWDMTLLGWGSVPLGIVILILVLEGGRRAVGSIYLVISIIAVLFPLFASYMPGILSGRNFPFSVLVVQSVFRSEGLLGIPVRIIAEYLVGFLVFAGVLIASGAGEFFIMMANALLGRFRGGPAKVSVVSSALFGSLSGSIYSNIAATGTFTIPTMKRLGYPAHYAAAIEACASTGGVIMPPVMGAIAFIMCELVGVEYRVVIVAAALPAILYYFGMFMQVDFFAARAGLVGSPRERIPSLRKILPQGWTYLLVLLFLIWGLVYMRWESYAPWYAAVLMLLLSFSKKETSMTPRRLLSTLQVVGRLIVQTCAIILPMGFIICGLTITGVSGSFTSGLVMLGKENIFIVLIMGVAACYLMGMVGMGLVAYIFLAVTLAPALIRIGDFNILAIHLFIIYYSILGGITPPVAGAAFFAAALAGANPMRTAWQAMRLGIVIYFIPFYFIFNPSLVLQGSLLDTLLYFPLCLVGIVLIAAGCEGYMLKLGKVGLWWRPLLVISGLLIGYPEWKTTAVGTSIAFFVLVMMWLAKKQALARNASV